MDSEPMAVGTDGKLYFMISKFSSTGMSNHIYMYDPLVGGKPVLRTPANATMQLESFKVDNQNRLFIKSMGTPSYLRFYPAGSSMATNIYYDSSSSNTWVRGYSMSPQGNAVVINGNNVRGMNGIIRVNLNGAEVVSHELLYSNTVDGSWIRLVHRSNEQWVTGTELLVTDESGSTNWKTETLTSGQPDAVKITARVKPYFIGDFTIKSDKTAFVLSGDLNVVDSSSTIDNTRTLKDWIVNHPEDFLRNYFDGNLMKDWLVQNGLPNFNVDAIGSLIWGIDGCLYGLYNPQWWGPGQSSDMKTVKLLKPDGSRDLKIVSLTHAANKPSQIKIKGEYLYYRYAILDNFNQETGTHRLARRIYTSTNGFPDEELIQDPALSGKMLEILNYDVSEDNQVLYFSALDYASNAVIVGKIDLFTKAYTPVQSATPYGIIRVY